MGRKNVFNVRLSDEELAKLQVHAKGKQVSAAEVLRDYIKRLPRRSEDAPTDYLQTYKQEKKRHE